MAKGNKYADIVKTSFAASLGAVGGLVVYMLISLVFLLPGIVIIMMQLKKNKKDRSVPMLVVGFVLAFLGVALGFGMGGMAVIEMLGDALSDS